MKQKPAPWLVRTGKVLWEAPLIFTKTLMVGLGLIITLLIIGEVAFRYVVFAAQLWVEELTLFIVFWFYFAGGVYATYKRSHIACGIVHLIFHNKPRAVEGFHLAATAIATGLCVLMVILASRQFAFSLEMNPRTIRLLLPLAYSRLALSVGFSLMIIYFLAELIASIRSLKGLPAITAPWSKQ